MVRAIHHRIARLVAAVRGARHAIVDVDCRAGFAAQQRIATLDSIAIKTVIAHDGGGLIAGASPVTLIEFRARISIITR